MRKILFLLVMMATFSLTAFAQNQTVEVKGTVTAQNDGEPIIGATVQGKGTTIGTSTDVNGNFTINLPAYCKKLIISYVGMYTVETDVKPVVNVVMEENTETLTEVVVTGYGTMKKVAFTGAASVVTGETVDKKSDMNFVKSLEGQVTGLQYNNVSNSPGMYGSVSIRGFGTINSSSQPLYVIDGIPVNAEVISNSSSSSNNFFDPMAAYNPNDIESISVLKDAAATAIYGSRAANGVIVITTKRGGKGKLNATFETRQGFNTIANNNMKFANAQQLLPFLARGYYAQGRVDSYEEGVEYVTDYFKNLGWDGYSSYDWLDKISRKGYYQDYNLSVNGTSGQTNYYINLNYNSSEGVIIASKNSRYGGRVNIDTQYSIFSLGANTSYSYSIFDGFSQSTGGTYSNPIYSAMTQMNVFMPYYIDGEYANYKSYYNPIAIWDKDLGNIDQTKTQTINLNPWLKVDLPYDFWIKTNFGANITNVSQYGYDSAVYYRGSSGFSANGTGEQFNSTMSMLTWTNTIGWSHTYGLNYISVLLGQEMQKRHFTESYFERTNFPYAGAGMRDISTAATPGDSGSYTEETRLASYFADVHYDFDNRYYLSASFRRDGSSVFGDDKRWANFWSVGGKWRISEEPWLRNNTTLTNADIRLSYGTVGNQSIGAYAARGVYSLDSGYSYDGNPGMAPEGISNRTLTWETSKKFDVGFDISFINRWHLTFDFYNEDTDDLLYKRPLSYVTGMSSAWSNIGKIRNRGIELGINGTAFHSNDALINVFANLTFNKNKVVELAEESGRLEYSYEIVEVGRPYYQWYMIEYAGVDRATGEPLYYLNEEGDETTTDYSAAAKRYLGTSLPKVYGAFGINGNAFGFDYSIQFNYRLGAKLYNSLPRGFGWGYQFRAALLKVVENSWTPETPDAKYPQYLYSGSTVSSNYSSRWLMNGDYLRIGNITVGYTIPQKLTRKIFIDKCRFFVTLDNVYTWTKSDFTGWTPDTRADGNVSSQYPGVLTFTGGVQLSF